MSDVSNSTKKIVGSTLEDKEYYDVFISYRRRDEKYALLLRKSLEAQGLRVFFDHVSIKNENFPEKIRKAIVKSKNFILIMTKGVFNHGENIEGRDAATDWVHEELRTALENNVNYILVQTKEEPPDYNGLPDELRKKIEYVNTRILGAGQLFEPSLTNILSDLKNVQLRDRKKANEVSYKSTVFRLLENDCKIDSDERSQLDQARESLNISREEQVRYEDDVQTTYLRGLKERNEKIKGENDRLTGDVRTLKEDNNKLKDENIKLNVELKAENNKLKVWRVCCIILGVIGFFCLGGWLWTGVKGRDGTSHGSQLAWQKEREQFEKKLEKARQDADREKAIAEEAKREVQMVMTEVEKRVTASALAREQAEKEIKDVKTRLTAALKSATSSDAARQDAENRLVQTRAALEAEQAGRAKDKTIIEGREKELLDKLAKEQVARRDAEVQSSEKAAELERANGKIQALDADRLRLQNELDMARERKQIEADRDVL